MPRRPLPWLALLPLLAACDPGLPAAPEATDPLEDAAPSPLAEQLYGGELGADAKAAGDRVRLLIWLRRMALAPDQLRAFRDAGAALQAAQAITEERVAAAGAAEWDRLRGPYGEMAAALAAGEPDDDALERWSAALDEAQTARADPRVLQMRLVDRSLELAHDLLGQLDPAQQREVVNALFLLREQVGVGVAPDAWRDLMGDPWPDGDFSTLRRSASPPDMDHLDVGGLWTLDAGATRASSAVSGLKLQAVLALALAHPGLPGACEVLLGERAPMDLSTHGTQ